MHRGCSHLQSTALNRFGKFRLAKAASVFTIGVILSGCVATTLTPTTSTPALFSDLSPALEELATSPETNAATDTVEQPTTDIAASDGITVPVRRPGSKVASQQQLALAKTDTPSVAAQKAEKIALVDNGIAVPKAKSTTDPTVAPITATVAPPKKPASKGFFASLFQSSSTPRPKRAFANNTNRKSAANNNRKVAVFRPVSEGALPGVRKLGLFGIYDSREGADEGYDTAVRLASIGGLARTSPNGLRIQHSGVQVACLRPGLVRIIKQVQRRYGRVPIVTSGYRSPSANRRARGARNSMHIYCKAADIQVAGVSKWALAKYLRSLPGRGGVGTYCHTKSVHIDVGSKRDWNWRCRRGKKRAKRRNTRKRKG